MADKEGAGFWGLVIAFATVAIAGAVALIRSFRTSRDGGRTWEGPAQGKDSPKPGGGNSGHVRPDSKHDADK